MNFRVDSINSLVENLLTHSLASTQQVEDNLSQQTQDILSGYMDNLSISALGRHINELYSGLQEVGSEEAQLGFRQLMTELAQEPDNLDTLNFVDTATSLREAEGETYADVFEMVNNLTEADMNARGWFNTLQHLDKEQVDEYVDTTGKIAADEELGEGVLSQLMSAINEVSASEDLPEEEIDSLLDQLISGVAEQNTVAGMGEFIENFVEEVI